MEPSIAPAGAAPLAILSQFVKKVGHLSEDSLIMAQNSFVRRTVRRVLRGTSWFASAARYNERFPRIFRAGKWRPAVDRPLWMSLFGARQPALVARGRADDSRRSLLKMLRVESLERRQMLAINVAVVGGADVQTGFEATVDQLNNDTHFDFNATLVPPTAVDTVAKLNNYDVVVIGSAHTTASMSDSFPIFSAALRDWVQAGGGVVATGWTIDGVRLGVGTEREDLDAILGIDLAGGGESPPRPQVLTIAMTSHPITDGVSGFAIDADSNVEVPINNTPDDGATVIANISAGGSTRLGGVVFEVGTGGRSVYLGPLYMADAVFYDTGDLRTGEPDQLLEQAVAWAANVPEENAPPVAHAAVTSPIDEGQDLVLDGSASSDPDGDAIVEYAWDLDGDGVPEIVTPDAVTSARWIEELAHRAGIDDEGDYTASLRVRDITGLESETETVPFRVDNTPPDTSITGGHVVAIGHDYVVTFESTDPGSDTITHVFIDWGDGSPIQRADVTEGSSEPGESKRTLLIPHVFETKGTKDVTFYAVDEDCDDGNDNGEIDLAEAYASNTLAVTVVAQPPDWETPIDLSLAENDDDGVGLEATDDRTTADDLIFEITGGADQGLFAIVESGELVPRIRLSPVPFSAEL